MGGTEQLPGSRSAIPFARGGMVVLRGLETVQGSVLADWNWVWTAGLDVRPTLFRAFIQVGSNLYRFLDLIAAKRQACSFFVHAFTSRSVRAISFLGMVVGRRSRLGKAGSVRGQGACGMSSTRLGGRGPSSWNENNADHMD